MGFGKKSDKSTTEAPPPLVQGLEDEISPHQKHLRDISASVPADPNEKDPDYDRKLIERRAADALIYTKTRVVKSMPKEKKEADPDSVKGKLKSFKSKFGGFKSPVLSRADEAPKVEETTYHVNEKGEIIETRKIRAGNSAGWGAFV